MSVDELVARYKALDREVDALIARHDQVAEPDRAAIKVALSGRYDDMARTCGDILDMLLGPGGSGRQAA